MDSVDKVVEFAILIGVWVGVWLEWQSLQEKRKSRIRRIVNNVLKRCGVPV
jgi:hypothetical protein